MTGPITGVRTTADGAGSVPHDSGRSSARTSVLVGAVCGLAWASGLRGLMAEIAGSASTVEWHGTFVGVLLPGVVTGVLLGWAEHLRVTGGRPGWRWLALAPLSFPLAVFTTPGQITALLEQALGGGALAVAAIGMLGGYALSGRGPRWGRALAAILPLASVPAWGLMAAQVGGPDVAVHMPRGAWIALFYFSFLATLALAAATPHRPVVVSTSPG